MQADWLHVDFFTLISGLAIMMMAVALWKAFEYKSAMPAGTVLRIWRLLTALIGLFFICYLALPFFVFLPPEWKDNIISLLFLLGAVYVLATLNLLFKIVITKKE